MDTASLLLCPRKNPRENLTMQDALSPSLLILLKLNCYVNLFSL
jgi:hypothetical protein